MARTHRLNDSSGFTLIEVLIAIAIFSIGLMAIGALQARTLMDTGSVARKTEAWALLEQQAELLKQMPFYQDVATRTHPPALVAGAFGAPRQAVSQDGRYTIQWQVVDDEPIGPQDETVLPGVPVGNYTVSKQITMVAIRPGGNPLTPLAQVEFFKVWWATGIP